MRWLPVPVLALVLLQCVVDELGETATIRMHFIEPVCEVLTYSQGSEYGLAQVLCPTVESLRPFRRLW